MNILEIVRDNLKLSFEKWFESELNQRKHREGLVSLKNSALFKIRKKFYEWHKEDEDAEKGTMKAIKDNQEVCKNEI